MAQISRQASTSWHAVTWERVSQNAASLADTDAEEVRFQKYLTFTYFTLEISGCFGISAMRISSARLFPRSWFSLLLLGEH